MTDTCPVCLVSISKSQLMQHVNQCLDKEGSARETKQAGGTKQHQDDGNDCLDLLFGEQRQEADTAKMDVEMELKHNTCSALLSAATVPKQEQEQEQQFDAFELLIARALDAVPIDAAYWAEVLQELRSAHLQVVDTLRSEHFIAQEEHTGELRRQLATQAEDFCKVRVQLEELTRMTEHQCNDRLTQLAIQQIRKEEDERKRTEIERDRIAAQALEQQLKFQEQSEAKVKQQTQHALVFVSFVLILRLVLSFPSPAI